MGNNPSGKAQTYVFTPAQAEKIRAEQGALCSRFKSGDGPVGCAAAAPGGNVENTVGSPAAIPILWFGKLHYVSLKIYARDAELYHIYHWKDAFLLWQNARSCAEIYEAWAYPTRFADAVTAGTVELYDATATGGKNVLNRLFGDWFAAVEKMPKPSLELYGTIGKNALGVIERMAAWDLSADQVVQNGVDLELIRLDLKELNKMVNLFRERAIDRAGQTIAGLETVESASFSILNVVPTLTMMDPVREAIWKIGVLLARVVARGAGGAISWGTLDGFYNEAWRTLKVQVPNLIADLVLLPVNRLCTAMGLGKFGRELVIVIIQQIVEMSCSLYAVLKENEGKRPTKEQWEALLVERLSSLIGTLISRLVPSKFGDSWKKTVVKSLAENVARVLVQDIYNAYAISDKTGQPMFEVMWNDLPKTILRLVEMTFIGYLQRHGAKTQQYMNDVGRVGKSNYGVLELSPWKEAKDLGNVPVSVVNSTGRVPLGTVHSVRNRRTDSRMRAPYFTTQIFREGGWSKTPLEYRVAAGVYRYTDEAQVFALFHEPGETRSLHTGVNRGAKLPKPFEMHLKTSNHPDLDAEIRGLNLKPTDGHGTKESPDYVPPTHDDMAGPRDTWAKEWPKLKAKGFLVREDRVIFRPDQAEAWGNRSGRREEGKAAAATLETLIKHDAQDLNDPATRTKIDELVQKGVVTRDQVDRTMAFLKGAKIGFYSDLDIADLVDAKNGGSLFMGTDKEGDPIDLADYNRRNFNEYFQDFKDADGTALRPEAIGGSKGYVPDQRAHAGDVAQHGASSAIDSEADLVVLKAKVPVKVGIFTGPGGEMERYTPSDEVKARLRAANPDPDAYKQAIHKDIMEHWDAWVKARLPKDVQLQNLSDRIGKMQKELTDLKTKAKYRKVKVPKVTPEQLKKVDLLMYPVEVIDEPAYVGPVEELAVQNAMVHRGLSIHRDDVSKVLGGRYIDKHEFNSVMSVNKTVIGVTQRKKLEIPGDQSEEIVIAAIHNEGTIGDVLRALIRTAKFLAGTDGNSQTTVKAWWYEIHTAYRPITTDFVVNRLGLKDPGVLKKVDPPLDCSAMNCFKPPKTDLVYTFSAIDFVESFTPDRKRYGPVYGMKLFNVLEDQTNKRLWYQETLHGDYRISVFYKGLVADTSKVTAFLTPRPSKKKGQAPLNR